MAFESQENQLELFKLQHQPAPRPHREMLGRFLLHLRYDQLVLAGMAGIIGVTVIFACGVERGKQLVRSERSMLVRQQPATPTAAVEESPSTAPALTPAPSVKETREKPVQTPTSVPKVKTKLASAPVTSTSPVAERGLSRYAIQVVTFSRPFLAKQEMDRLVASGERAFLVMRDGRTMVYVGPFPSKTHAADKLLTLKSRYQDCFVRTL